MIKNILRACALLIALATTPAFADQVLIIDAQYDQVTNNVKGRLEAAGHTVTVTTNLALIPTVTTTYQQVWDLRYAAALTASEQTTYQTYVTNGGFAYFVTENPGCCQARNNSVAALITALGGGTTTIGANFAMTNNVSSNVNTKYMTAGITVNYAAVSAIINSQGIPLISDGAGAVSGMSWIGRAGALGQGVTGTIVTVADTNWLDQSRFSVAQGATIAQQQNVTALDDIIRGIVAGTVAGTISANGNGAGATNGNNGTPTPPTVVSTAAGTPTVTTSASNGTATSSDASTRGATTNTMNAVLGTTVTTSSNRDVAAKNAKTIDVTRTTTVVRTTPRTTTVTSTTPVTTITTTVTPRTTTTTTVPVTITTYSDGSTTSTNGTPVVTTSTVNVATTSTTTVNEVVVSTIRDSVVQTTASNQTESVNATATSDAIKIRNTNPFLVDVLSQKDGAWISPTASYYKTVGNMKSGGSGLGYQWSVDNNTFGVAFGYVNAKSGGLTNNSIQVESYDSTAYALVKDNDVWVKVAVGAGIGNYTGSTSIPTFALYNNSKFKQYNYYSDLTLYTAVTIEGFRPLIGVMINQSQIKDYNEVGSVLLSTQPATNSTTINPYIGLRYDFDQNIGIEGRVTQTKDFKTVFGARAVAKTEIDKGIYLNATVGFNKGTGYTSAVGTIGLKVDF